MFATVLVLLKMAPLCWNKMVKVYPLHFRCLLVAHKKKKKIIPQLSLHVVNIHAAYVKFMNMRIDVQINTYIYISLSLSKKLGVEVKCVGGHYVAHLTQFAE